MHSVRYEMSGPEKGICKIMNIFSLVPCINNKDQNCEIFMLWLLLFYKVSISAPAFIHQNRTFNTWGERDYITSSIKHYINLSKERKNHTLQIIIPVKERKNHTFQIIILIAQYSPVSRILRNPILENCREGLGFINMGNAK